MRVLVTRAREDAEETAADLTARGHSAVIAPLLVLRATGVSLPDAPFDAVLATSRHALDHLKPEARDATGGHPWFVVGARLAAALGESGAVVAHVAPDARALAAHLRTALAPASRLLYLAGTDRKPDLETALAGHRLQTRVVYEAVETDGFPPAVLQALRAGRIDVALHFSRRSAALFLKAIAAAGLGPVPASLHHICISADAAAPLAQAGLTARIAPTPDRQGLFAALQSV